MASVQEKLAESLKVLKDYQDTHDNLVIKGWYIPSFPGSEGDTKCRQNRCG